MRWRMISNLSFNHPGLVANGHQPFKKTSMKRRIDYAVLTGKAHENDATPGQDYCLAGTFPEGHAQFIAVSDGCSSGAHTQLGSATIVRMLTKTLVETYQKLFKDASKQTGGFLDRLMGKQPTPDIPVKFFSAIDTRLKAYIDNAMKTWFLRDTDMSATLLYGVFTKTEGLIRVLGDGVVGIKFRDGSYNLFQFTWNGKAPYYPYFNTGDRRNAFIQEYGGNIHAISGVECRIVTNVANNLPGVPLFSTTHIDEDIRVEQLQVERINVLIQEEEEKKPRFVYKRPYEPELPTEPIEPKVPEKSQELIKLENERKDPKYVEPQKSFLDKMKNIFVVPKDPYKALLETHERTMDQYERERKAYEARKRNYAYALETYDRQKQTYEKALVRFNEDRENWLKRCQPYNDRIDELKKELIPFAAAKNRFEKIRDTYLKKLKSEEFYGDYKVGSDRKEFKITERYTLDHSMRGIQLRLNEKDMANISCIIVATDGVGQMTGLTWEDATKQMLDYTEDDLLAHDKNPKAQGFARQKLASILRKGNSPMDDVAVSALYIDHEKKVEKT